LTVLLHTASKSAHGIFASTPILVDPVTLLQGFMVWVASRDFDSLDPRVFIIAFITGGAGFA
jgi:hypothetical protein